MDRAFPRQLVAICLLGAVLSGCAETADPGPAGSSGDSAANHAGSAGEGGDHDPDRIDVRCMDLAWQPSGERDGEEVFTPSESADHVPLPEPIDYGPQYRELPPSGGPHRGHWARWGEYASLAPQRWVHNLEHGGVALLYHPCAGDEAVETLRAYAHGRAADEGGPFRWVLTPWQGLPTKTAVVAWEIATFWNAPTSADLEGFVSRHYRKAPEDVSADGNFDDGWLGR